MGLSNKYIEGGLLDTLVLDVFIHTKCDLLIGLDFWKGLVTHLRGFA